MILRGFYTLIFVTGCIFSPCLLAQLKQKSDIHVHTHGEVLINMAAEGRTLVIEIETPAINLLTFEHVPETAEEQEELETVYNDLKNPESFFFIDEVSCELSKTEIDLPTALELEREFQEHEEGEEDLVHRGVEHNNLRMLYYFQCAINGDLPISFPAFNLYSSIQVIKVQWVSDKGQGTKELTSTDHSFILPR